MKHLNVPVHSLGISQIVSFGLLFYAFAQLKTPLAQNAGVSETTILAAVSGALVIQGLLAQVIGRWIDHFGGLRIMQGGFLIGALGIGLLSFYPSFAWICACFVLMGVSYAMCTYEVAFGSAVQLDEPKARRNISIITFYGGIASTITWMSVAPMLEFLGLQTTCLCLASLMLVGAWRFRVLSQRYQQEAPRSSRTLEPFRWSLLTQSEKQVLLTMGLISTLGFLTFTATSMFWINLFSEKFADPALAVVLASLYGPFQVVGRLIEMKFGHRFDARLSGIVATFLMPLALTMIHSDAVEVAILAMVLFGMGQGVLTVTYGFVTNLYFRAAVYGRAKGLMIAPRAVIAALGPSIGGILYAQGADQFLYVMAGLMLVAMLLMASLLRLPPTNEIHLQPNNS
ncbi:MAG: MFS transporter [Deltaproteobacteria bacterium]